MNLLFHQLRKDLRHTRVLVGMWLVLVIARFALVGWNVDPGDAGMQSVFSMVSILTVIFGFLLILVLVPQVIHQEPLVGTLAFWFTRPLSRATLLGSKVLFFALLVALPMIVQTIVFLTNGVTLHDVALAIPQLFLSQATWMLTLAALAVLTPSSGRFIVTGAIVLVSVYIFEFIVQVARIFSGDLGQFQVAASLTSSRTIVSDLLLIGFASATVINQYLTRRTKRSIVLALAALISSQIVSLFWPLDFMKPPVAITSDPGFHVEAIGTPSMVSNLNVSDQAAFRGGDPSKTVQGTLVIPGCPPGYLVKVNEINSTLKTADGHTIETTLPANFYAFNRPSRETIERALGDVPVLNMQGISNGISVALFAMSATTYRDVVSSELDYTGFVTGEVCKYASTAEIPVVKGGRFVQGSDRETISNVLEQGKGVEIQMQKQSINLLFAPQPNQDRTNDFMSTGKVLYVLVNRKRHEALIQKQDNSFFPNFNLEEILSHQPVRIGFGPEDNDSQRALLPTLDKAWLADAMLVRLELAPVSLFSRTLAVPHFRLDGSFRGGNVPTVSRVADLNTLDKITLPVPATRDQTRNYISSILLASAQGEAFTDHDPQIRMLEQVGPQNVDLLIDLTRTSHSFYLNWAIRDLVREDHRDLVIAAFPSNHDLIDVIVGHHWEKDASAALLAALAGNGTDGTSLQNIERGDAIAVALASLKDPKTYPVLSTYYVQRPDRRLFDTLAACPGFDVKAMVDAAWQNRVHAQEWEIRNVLGPAFQFNEPDVLNTALKLLKTNDRYTEQMVDKTLRTYTPVVGSNESELIAWITAHKDKLVFDPAAKKFVLQGEAPMQAPVPPVSK